MLLEPDGQFSSAETTRGKVEHETLLLIDGGMDLGAVEQKKGGHRSVSHALVPVDEGMPLREREPEGSRLLDQAAVEVSPSERGPRLSHGRFKSAEITDSRRTVSCCEHEAVQLDYLTQGEIAHQARRRYNSSNLRTTSAAAFWKSSSGAVRMSATTARASSSGDSPSLSASWRSRSAWVADSSMLSFMAALYRGGAPSNKPLERPGLNSCAAVTAASAGRSAPIRWADAGSCGNSWRDLMEITITTVEPSPDGLLRVSFAAQSGSGKGIWRGPDSRPGDVYQVELTLLDELEPGRNVYSSLEQGYSLSITADTIAMNVLVESTDPDGVAKLRLGSDCLFLAEVVRGRLQPGQWVRVCVHIAKLELWPYDSGSFTVVER